MEEIVKLQQIYENKFNIKIKLKNNNLIGYFFEIKKTLFNK